MEPEISERGLRRLRTAFSVLPPNVQGALWLLASAAIFSCMQVLAKFLGQNLGPMQVAFARAFFGLIPILPFLVRAGLGSGGFRSNVFPLQILRGVVGTAAMMCGFYAITHLPLADAQSLNFARGLFLVPLAILILREIVGPRRLMAAAIGFTGVVIMLRPTGAIDPAAFVALGGAVLVALATILVKIVSRHDAPVTLMFYTGIVGSLVTAVPAWLTWVAPTALEFFMLVMVGVLGAAAHNCFIRGYAVGETTAVAPFEYSTLIFVTIGGFLVFGNVPDWWTAIGAAIIVGSSLYIVRREAQSGQAPTPKEPPAA